MILRKHGLEFPPHRLHGMASPRRNSSAREGQEPEGDLRAPALRSQVRAATGPRCGLVGRCHERSRRHQRECGSGGELEVVGIPPERGRIANGKFPDAPSPGQRERKPLEITFDSPCSPIKAAVPSEFNFLSVSNRGL
jgi:hypothetical protein